MTATQEQHTAPGRAPRSFYLWLGVATLTGLGTAVMDFAVSWTASGLGAQIGGLVNTLIVLPRALLLLFGGVMGDRWGPRRVMIVTDVAKALVLVGVVVAAAAEPPGAVLLAIIGLAVGVITSFSMPATGVFPRLFVDDEGLPQVMAQASGLNQIARMVGPPLGGVLVIVWGLSGVAAVELGALLLALVVLIMIRPPREAPPVPRTASTLRTIGEGIGAAVRTPGIPQLLGAVALVASSVLPMLFLCLPLAARERGWSAAQTGAVETAWVVGTLSLTVVIAKFGAHRRAGWFMIGGPLVAAVGIVIMALTSGLIAALVGSVIMGLGTTLFTAHAFPVFVRQTPAAMLVRFQSLMGIAQAAPMVVTNNVFGLIAADGRAGYAMLTAAAMCLVATLIGLGLRNVTYERSAADHGDRPSTRRRPAR